MRPLFTYLFLQSLLVQRVDDDPVTSPVTEHAPELGVVRTWCMLLVLLWRALLPRPGWRARPDGVSSLI